MKSLIICGQVDKQACVVRGKTNRNKRNGYITQGSTKRHLNRNTNFSRRLNKDPRQVANTYSSKLSIERYEVGKVLKYCETGHDQQRTDVREAGEWRMRRETGLRCLKKGVIRAHKNNFKRITNLQRRLCSQFANDTIS